MALRSLSLIAFATLASMSAAQALPLSGLGHEGATDALFQKAQIVVQTPGVVVRRPAVVVRRPPVAVVRRPRVVVRPGVVVR